MTENEIPTTAQKEADDLGNYAVGCLGIVALILVFMFPILILFIGLAAFFGG